ncbi:MAG: RNA polymerase sigma-70 factor [Bacteroidales bacterium]|nr:RNA polymerase sigma-70 factor [Bacteroides sp.]MCM1197458.1 RNA polymerase sigma-70 factor [Clostridium sp.]MCM1501176.1 RNA polymerase sigma-70 factor [Bacteroidales bacterium]
MFAEKQIQYEKFVVDYQPRLMAYVLHFVDNRSDAQDILQESFITLWTKYLNRSAVEYPQLIFRITRNKCLDYLKHRKVVDSYFEPIRSFGEERLYNCDFGLGGADSRYIYEELQSQVDSILDTLPDKCREVFVMSRFKKMKNREIAEKLGISVSMVEKHIRRGLGAFTEALGDNTPLLWILVMSWEMMDKM